VRPAAHVRTPEAMLYRRSLLRRSVLTIVPEI
jgi:hypothetical protein